MKCQPRTTTLCLAAILAGMGFGGRAWLIGKASDQAVMTPAEKTVPSFDAGQAIRAKPAEGEQPGPVLPDLTRKMKAVKPLPLSSDATILVAEMCDLQLMAHGTKLNLSSQQWTTLAEVVVRTQAIRQTYEAEIATSRLISPGRYRVDIPAYSAVGDELRGKFITDLRSELGEALTVDVLAELGDRLEARFAGFGVSLQTLDITGNPQGTLSDVQVTRTVTYWNSLDGSNQPITRRETHFPAWEDPTGDSWNALLAMVKA